MGKSFLDNGNIGNNTLPENNGPKGRRFLIVIIMSVAIVLLLASFAALSGQPTTGQGRQQILKYGDQLRYDVAGELNNTSITPIYFIATILNSTSLNSNGDVGYEIISHDINLSTADRITPPNLGHDFKPYLSEFDQRGKNSDIEKISTNLGVKNVKVLSINDTRFNEIDTIYIGLDSSIVYRWSVTASSGEYQYTIDLNSTTNTLIYSVDM